MIDVVVLGQTPPPVHGQALMIQRLLAGRFERVRLHHVRMAFSDSVAEVGALRPGKALHLAELVPATLLRRLRTGATVLYYPPAGPSRVPVWRDLVLLTALRPWFRRTVFHFHAGGVSELRSRLSQPERLWFDRAYGHPDVAIHIAPQNPPDGERLGARHNLIVPHGMEDVAGGGSLDSLRASGPPVVLFVGMVAEEKGVEVLLEACALLKRRGLAFSLELMGELRGAEYGTALQRRVGALGLRERVRFLGPLTGPAKWDVFRRASLLCHPTHYAAETFGLVLLEAMQFSLPVVATRWRGLQSIVREGETGWLVPPRDAAAVAARVEELLGSAELRRELGASGRRVFLQEYSLERFWRRMEDAFVLACAPEAGDGAG